jgi:hypothetical protein
MARFLERRCAMPSSLCVTRFARKKNARAGARVVQRIERAPFHEINGL